MAALLCDAVGGAGGGARPMLLRARGDVWRFEALAAPRAPDAGVLAPFLALRFILHGDDVLLDPVSRPAYTQARHSYATYVKAYRDLCPKQRPRSSLAAAPKTSRCNNDPAILRRELP